MQNPYFPYLLDRWPCENLKGRITLRIGLVFAGDNYGDHALLCAGIIGVKHHHNVVRDTLVDICYRSGISADKEVNIGLDGGA
ncbi:hypothetical protein Tco_1454934 [Tanacetum coccineum]